MDMAVPAAVGKQTDSHLAIARLLLESGADPNITDNLGLTALIRFLWDAQVPFIRILLEFGANTEVGDDGGGRTEFELARDRSFDPKYREICELFQRQRVQRAPRTYTDNSIAFEGDWDEELLQAAESGDCEAVRRALERGANVNCPTNDGWAPLLEAVVHGPGIVEHLLGAGADPNIASKHGYTPLMRAAGHESHPAAYSTESCHPNHAMVATQTT